MLSAPACHDIKRQFPQLQDSSLLAAIEQSGIYVELDRTQGICHEGDACSHLALLLDGSARVYKLAESGREITLYRVEPGECCILTASCILSDRHFPAFALAETPLQGVLIPAAKVGEWMNQHASWRKFIWDLMAGRLADVISLVEEVAFRRMDKRIIGHLNSLCRLQQSTELTLTHQQIAADLGTSREVVSRILKDLQQQGLLHVSRGHIHIDNPVQLEKTAREGD